MMWGGKLLRGIKSIYVDSLFCVRVKGSTSEWFRIDSGVRQGCIMHPCLFNVYMDAVMKEMKIRIGRRGVRFKEEGREWRLPGPLYADDLVLCGESAENLRAIVGGFVEVCRRIGLKGNAGKSKVMVMNGGERLECEFHVDGVRLEHVYELKYLGFVLDIASTDGAECGRKVTSGRRLAVDIRSLYNAMDLQIECARVLHETSLVPILMYGSETMLWKEKERSRIRAEQMDNLRGLLGIRRVFRLPNARIRELCGATKGVDERVDEDILRWFGHVERMEKERIAKRVYVGECDDFLSVGRPRKRWADTVKDCLRKRCLDVRQARRMVQDKRE